MSISRNTPFLLLVIPVYRSIGIYEIGVGKTSMLKAYLEAEMNESNVTTNINIVNGLNSKSPTYCSSGYINDRIQKNE